MIEDTTLKSYKMGSWISLTKKLTSNEIRIRSFTSKLSVLRISQKWIEWFIKTYYKIVQRIPMLKTVNGVKKEEERVLCDPELIDLFYYKLVISVKSSYIT